MNDSSWHLYIYALMIIYDKSRHHPDISTVGLGFPSRLQLARLRPSPPWAAPFGCRMLLFFFLTENGTRKRRWRRPSRPCPTLWNHVFHGPFTDLSCLFVDFKAVMEIVLFENTLSDTFSLSAFFSFLTLVLFGSQISSASVPKGLRFFIHFRESQVPQGHHAAVHWSHPELFTSLRLDHIPSYSIHQLN